MVDGETVVETFEGVEKFDNPPMTSALHFSYADEEQDDERLTYGTVVRATTDNDDREN